MLARRVFSLGMLGLAARARAEATTVDLRLDTPPHPPGDAPDLVVHVPARLDLARPVHAAVFLHGFSCCARALVSDEPVPCYSRGPSGQAYGLAARHDATATNSLLVVPQLAMLARDARAPRLARTGGFDALMQAAYGVAEAHVGRAVSRGRVLLVAHSAGYRAAADILSQPVRPAELGGVLLLDALYARWDDFARFVRAGGLVVSLHTGEARTTAGNAHLLARLGPRGARRSYDELERALGPGRGLVARVTTPHGTLPARHYTELVRALLRDAAPPAGLPGSR
jgi:hypothetical protein